MEEYIKAAPDSQLSFPESKLLTTLLSREDQYDYNQLQTKSLLSDTQHLLHQISSFLQLPPSTTWMAAKLLKKLLIQQHSINVLTILASVTLSSKYQDSSFQSIDYELLAHYYHIDDIQHIHAAEIDLLERLSYDIAVTTPDHFFSYLSNLNNDCKYLINQAQSLFSLIVTQSSEISEFLHEYPCSIIALSLLCMNTSDIFVFEQIKCFIAHKKDPSHYLNQLLHCIAQLRHVLSQ
ncbi:unnamed protein product [Adineta ricciae]|uniref:Uncharacterized protein n=1 Tax=Adineta ricciae TaxID=249248 RepID=A0A816FFJ2_ADIRI|nr:unnamed protein product [Adineta ricciae]